MTKNECKNEIFSFKVAIDHYRRTVLNNDNPLSWDVRSKIIPMQRSQLNQKYGKLEKYLGKIGGGVGQTYLVALGGGSHVKVISALSAVVQNLDRIIGRLDGMTEEEFADLFMSKPQGPGVNAPSVKGADGYSKDRSGDGGQAHFVRVGKGLSPEGMKIHDIRYPHRQYWGMVLSPVLRWAKKYTSEIVIGVIVIVLGTLVLAWLGLQP